MNKYKPVRGFRDIQDKEAGKMRYIINLCLNEGENFGCKYVILPTVEYIELFNRTMESSDLVNKETIFIALKEGQTDARALRGEGTAQAVRYAINTGLTEARIIYDGAFFRDERPQKGRFKEFRQIGVEFFYARDSYFEELEMFRLIDVIMKKLGITYKLRINNIGELPERKKYEEALADYVKANAVSYSENSLARLQTGKVLRILDSKEDEEINKGAPQILNYIDKNSKKHFDNIIAYLNSMDIEYEIDSTLVRGLDYYNGTVFEITSSLYQVESSQVAIGGGGRYDLLSSQLDGKNIKQSFGFAFGVDRLAACITLPTSTKPVLNIVMQNNDLKRLNETIDQFSSEYVIKIFGSTKEINTANKMNKTILI